MDIDVILDKNVVVELLNGERYRGKVISIGEEWILIELIPYFKTYGPKTYRFIPKMLIKYVEIRGDIHAP